MALKYQQMYQWCLEFVNFIYKNNTLDPQPIYSIRIAFPITISMIYRLVLIFRFVMVIVIVVSIVFGNLNLEWIFVEISVNWTKKIFLELIAGYQYAKVLIKTFIAHLIRSYRVRTNYTSIDQLQLVQNISLRLNKNHMVKLEPRLEQ